MARPVPGQRWGMVAIVLLLLVSGALVAYLYRPARDTSGDRDMTFAPVDGPVA